MISVKPKERLYFLLLMSKLKKQSQVMDQVILAQGQPENQRRKRISQIKNYLADSAAEWKKEPLSDHAD